MVMMMWWKRTKYGALAPGEDPTQGQAALSAYRGWSLPFWAWLIIPSAIVFGLYLWTGRPKDAAEAATLPPPAATETATAVIETREPPAPEPSPTARAPFDAPAPSETAMVVLPIQPNIRQDPDQATQTPLAVVYVTQIVEHQVEVQVVQTRMVPAVTVIVITATPGPTQTPHVITATPSDTPTATATHTPSPTATASPTSTATPITVDPGSLTRQVFLPVVLR